MKNIFKNKYVQVTLSISLSKSSYEEGQSTEIVKPLVIHGYFIKEDNNHLFLGDDPKEITVRIDKKKIVFLEVLKAEDQYDKLLEETSKSNYTN